MFNTSYMPDAQLGDPKETIPVRSLTEEPPKKLMFPSRHWETYGTNNHTNNNPPARNISNASNLSAMSNISYLSQPSQTPNDPNTNVINDTNRNANANTIASNIDHKTQHTMNNTLNSINNTPEMGVLTGNMLHLHNDHNSNHVTSPTSPIYHNNITTTPSATPSATIDQTKLSSRTGTGTQTRATSYGTSHATSFGTQTLYNMHLRAVYGATPNKKPVRYKYKQLKPKNKPNKSKKQKQKQKKEKKGKNKAISTNMGSLLGDITNDITANKNNSKDIIISGQIETRKLKPQINKMDNITDHTKHSMQTRKKRRNNDDSSSSEEDESDGKSDRKSDKNSENSENTDNSDENSEENSENSVKSDNTDSTEHSGHSAAPPSEDDEEVVVDIDSSNNAMDIDVIDDSRDTNMGPLVSPLTMGLNAVDTPLRIQFDALRRVRSNSDLVVIQKEALQNAFEQFGVKLTSDYQLVPKNTVARHARRSHRTHRSDRGDRGDRGGRSDARNGRSDRSDRGGSGRGGTGGVGGTRGTTRGIAIGARGGGGGRGRSRFQHPGGSLTTRVVAIPRTMPQTLAQSLNIRKNVSLEQSANIGFQNLGYGIDQLISPMVARANAFDFRAALRVQQLNLSTNEIVNEVPIEVIHGNCSYMETIFNMLNYLIGSCMLAIPYTLKLSGYAQIGILLLFCIFTGITGILITEILDKLDELNKTSSKQQKDIKKNIKRKRKVIKPACVKNYTDMIHIILGNRGRILVGLLLCFELYLYAVMQLIFGGQTLFALMKGFMTGHSSDKMELFDIFEVNNGLCIIMIAILILPTVYLRNLKPLSYLSTFGIISIVVIIIAIIKVFIQSIVNSNDLFYTTVAFTSINPMGYSVGISAASFSAHAAFPNMRASMKNNRQFGSVLIVTYAIVTCLLLMVGLMGYYTYGTLSQPLIQLNFDSNDVFSIIANVMLLVKCWSVTALLLFPVSATIEGVIPYGKDIKTNEDSFLKSLIVRSLLYGSVIVIAYVLPNFNFIANLVGTICAISMTLLFPSFAYIKLVKTQKIMDPDKWVATSYNVKKYVCIAMIIIGTSLAIWNLCELAYYGPNGP